jgi:hypothetical protein
MFFTGIIVDDKVINDHKVIAKKYLFGYFLIDILSCVPGIITGEEIQRIYYFKVLRYF